ncbi:MAG: COX15/CtaA family protein [Planctomycetota bacterium]|nr:COX15/CtaA family protein [Planctomycetota bacterium]
MSAVPPQLESPWPHRLAVVLCCATFPLIWIGGLVTTHEAGMAVPDWPNTYGYNLLLYPMSEWLNGPWNLFIEHGHRLFAVFTGLITIALTVTVWRTESRPWVRNAAIGVLGLVLLQGALGGMRVLFDARTLAMIHGCTGPLFFMACVGMAVVTSRRWKQANRAAAISTKDESRLRNLMRLGWLTTGLSYLQLVIGAQLRHISPMAHPSQSLVILGFHVLVACLLVAQISYLAFKTVRHQRGDRWLSRPVYTVLGLIFLQFALGVGTWVTNYGTPSCFTYVTEHAAHYTISAGGPLQTNITTAHVAVGSLILVTLFCFSLRATRRIWPTQAASFARIAPVGATA